ncbi:hypothetical protein HPB51_013910 [Rhipicephalus microplus]|uniref:Integrin alpha-2 domain-containing protein n=1 Tax=Rhipicephalus microplus TaxID=6941 RepID=A0A9J6D5D3_RHIMP|nr:hypothetical protein HPB51_013910 [Rhipicephalus microplus]
MRLSLSCHLLQQRPHFSSSASHPLPDTTLQRQRDHLDNVITPPTLAQPPRLPNLHEITHSLARGLVNRTGATGDEMDTRDNLTTYNYLVKNFYLRRRAFPPHHPKFNQASTLRLLQTNTYPLPDRLHLIFPDVYTTFHGWCWGTHPTTLPHMLWERPAQYRHTNTTTLSSKLHEALRSPALDAKPGRPSTPVGRRQDKPLTSPHGRPRPDHLNLLGVDKQMANLTVADFAVGAPYAGTDSRGAVYIFLGNPRGRLSAPSQVIMAEEVTWDLNTFGFSLSGGLDLDGNEYPDLLVGAYDSDAAVYLRSRPVVDLEATLKIDGDNLDLEDTTCTLRDGTRVPCYVMTVCLRYTGLGAAPSILVSYELALDTERKGPARAFLLEQQNSLVRNRTVRLAKDQQYCNSENAYVLASVFSTLLFFYNGAVQKTIRDKLTPITMRLRTELIQTVSTQSLLLPVLNGSRPANVTKDVQIRKNCGGDGVCVPDLKLRVTPNMEEFLIGSTGNVELSMAIDNRGEDAFETMMFLTIPPDLNYVKVEKGKLDPATCGGAQKLASGESQLACDVQNPLAAGKKARFKVILAPARLVPTASELNITVRVNSTNPEVQAASKDNVLVVQLPVTVKVNMTARGTSFPPEVYLNVSLIEDKEVQTSDDIGPPVKHVYELINRGPSVVQEADVYLVWPTHNVHDQPLLYLLEPPTVQGPGSTAKRRSCDVVSPAGPNEAVDPKRLAGCGELPRCAVFRCPLGGVLSAGDRAVVSAESRLWQRTAAAMGQERLRVSSKLVARVASLQYGLPPDNVPLTQHFVSTEVVVEGIDTPGRDPAWWIILLAVLGGLLLLGLLALLLWKLGFFKRKRPQDQEPLNPPEKNGYRLAQGDEAL